MKTQFKFCKILLVLALQLFGYTAMKGQNINFDTIDSTYGRSESSAILAPDGLIRRISTTTFNDPYWLTPLELRMETVDPVTGMVISNINLGSVPSLQSEIYDVKMTADGNIVFPYMTNPQSLSAGRIHVRKITPAGVQLFDVSLNSPLNYCEASSILVSSGGDIYVTGRADSSVTTNTFLWKINSIGASVYFKRFVGVTNFSSGFSLLEFNERIIVGIKPWQFNPYIMVCDLATGDSLSSIDLGMFIPYQMAMVKWPLLTIAGHLMSGEVGINYPGVLRINMLNSEIDSSILYNYNGSFSKMCLSPNGLTLLGYKYDNVDNGLLVGWLNTMSQFMDTLYINSDVNYHSQPDDIIILPNRNTIVLARSGRDPLPPPPNLPLPWIYYNINSRIIGIQRLPCTSPVALINPDTAYVCSQQPFTLTSVDNTIGNLYSWKRYSTMLPGDNNSIEDNRAGVYKLTVTSSTWCSKRSPKVYVNNITPDGTVTASGPTSICFGDSVNLLVPFDPLYTYEWHRNGVPVIPNVFTPNYTAIKGGTYKCIIVNQYGCSRVSQKVTVSVTGCLAANSAQKNGISESAINQISLWPNPATTQITLKGFVKSTIQITDVFGRIVMKSDASDGASVDISALAPGLYMLTTDQGASERFLKQ